MVGPRQVSRRVKQKERRNYGAVPEDTASGGGGTNLLTAVQTADAAISDDSEFLTISSIPVGRYKVDVYVRFDISTTGDLGLSTFLTSGTLSYHNGRRSYIQEISNAETFGTSWHHHVGLLNAANFEDLGTVSTGVWVFHAVGVVGVSAIATMTVRFQENGGTFNEIQEGSAFILTPVT